LGKKIMVVDDSLNMRAMLREVLEHYGYNVAGEEENGEKALELYEALRPDLVLLDINMPGMNGLDAMKEILKTDPGANIIIVSFVSNREVVEQALLAGARDFIVKPFPIDRLIQAAKKALSRNASG